MNSLVEFTATPATLLRSQTYTSASNWYETLADTHLLQLVFHHNDAVRDEDFARDGYVARQLFRNLASENRLAFGFSSAHDYDTENDFILFSEDLRPSNVLIDKDLRVVAVIDWEFVYYAPAQFSFDPPWWLLLKKPEDWPGAYVPFMEAYEPRLKTFRRVLREEELTAMQQSATSKATATLNQFSHPSECFLSTQMRKSWESKTWIINYAARDSWEFEFLFWRWLDPKVLGTDNESADHHARLALSKPAQKQVMDSFVEMKLTKSLERTLVDWDPRDAIQLLD